MERVLLSYKKNRSKISIYLNQKLLYPLNGFHWVTSFYVLFLVWSRRLIYNVSKGHVIHLVFSLHL